MILCVNANAAIDKTVVISPFRVNEIHRPLEVLALAGGKGCNVARALKTLGEDTLVTGWVGGFAGHWIESRLHDEGIETAFVHTEAESRTCLSILDPEASTLTEIYEKGQSIPADKLKALVQHFRRVVAGCLAVALSGSLPAGVPPDFYAQLTEIARSAGVPIYLDASGEPLKRGLAAQPSLIKPNKTEFADLVGGELINLDDYVSAAVEISERYDTTVVVSLGAAGAIAAFRSRVYHARPPNIRLVSAVGSGDCLLAGILYAAARGADTREQLRCGVAAGTANALRRGAGVFTLEDFDQIYAEVTCDSLA